MNPLLLISLIIIGVSSQTNHGCKTGCDCPDFSGLIREGTLNYTYTQMDGCSFKMSCLDGSQAFLQFSFPKSEIGTPSDSWVPEFITVLEGSRPYPSVDFLSTFGIVCENGAWIATKYNLTLYLDTKADWGVIPSETINGKKSPINYASCEYSTL